MASAKMIVGVGVGLFLHSFLSAPLRHVSHSTTGCRTMLLLLVVDGGPQVALAIGHSSSDSLPAPDTRPAHLPAAVKGLGGTRRHGAGHNLKAVEASAVTGVMTAIDYAAKTAAGVVVVVKSVVAFTESSVAFVV